MAATYPPLGPRATCQPGSIVASNRPGAIARTAVSTSKSIGREANARSHSPNLAVMRDTVTTSDGITLEAERAEADVPVAGAVLCHPNPQMGGTMRSIVVSALFETLPAAGVTCLRFNFRGVDGSAGIYDDGVGEQLDAEAA